MQLNLNVEIYIHAILKWLYSMANKNLKNWQVQQSKLHTTKHLSIYIYYDNYTIW